MAEKNKQQKKNTFAAFGLTRRVCWQLLNDVSRRR